MRSKRLQRVPMPRRPIPLLTCASSDVSLQVTPPARLCQLLRVIMQIR